MSNSSKSPKFYRLKTQEWLKVFPDLTKAELGVLYYIRTLDPFGDCEINVNSTVLGELLNLNRATVSRALKRLDRLGLINSDLAKNSFIECQIRDRLLINHFPTALKEVKCPAGRIDLLTDTEIIEVKKISDWKSALGQILVYSAFYPEHKKRIHLFGREADKEKLLDIELSCSAFDVLVSFEDIGGAEQ